MGLFRYEAVDKTGKILHGVMNARDEQEVAQNLSTMGYTVRAVHTRAGVQSASAAAVGTASQQQNPARSTGVQSAVIGSCVPVSVKSIVPPRALASFFRQLVTMVRSGIPLYQSFSDIVPYVKDSRLRKVLPHIQQTLQSGQKLSSAMAKFPEIFPVHATASIWAGELAGKLEIALNEVATDFEQEASDILYGRVGWGITKANLLGGIYVIPFCTIMRMFSGMIDQTREQNILNLTQFFTHSLIGSTLISLIVIASWVIWGHMKRKPAVKKWLDRIMLRVPIWGTIHNCRGQARFLRVLDQLYSAGIGVDTAWDAASLTPRNSALAEKLRLARSEQPQDAGITNLFSASGVFDIEAVGLASAGERSGQIPETLVNLAQMYEEKANTRRTAGKIASISAMTTFAIIVHGIALIMLVHGYANSYYDLMENIGNG